MVSIEVDNLNIHEWLPETNGGDIEKVIFAIHGLGAHGAWFERLATRLNAQGYAFYSYDLRGFGKSHLHGEGERGHVDSCLDWMDDNQKVYNELKNKYPNAKFAVMGHSLGGVLASNMYEIYEGDKLILSVPGYKGHPDKFDFFGFALPAYIKLLFDPKSYVDLPPPEEGSPTLDDKWRVDSVSAQLLGQILKLGSLTKKNIKEIYSPVLMIEIEGDEVVCNKTMNKYFDKISSLDKEIMVCNSYHDWIWYDAVDPISKEIARWVEA